MENKNEVNLPDIIQDKKRLPIEIKKRIRIYILFNVAMLIIMSVFALVIHISFYQLTKNNFEKYIDIIQVFCAIISIAILEVAYRKDSGKIGIYGIEFLLFSVAVLFVPHLYISKGDATFLRNVVIVFAVYYIVKSLGTFIYTKHRYIKNNISDIKELVKEEKKEGYINQESTKSLKEQKIENEKRKKEKEEKFKRKMEKQKGGTKND